MHRGGFAAARVLHAGMPGAEGVENLSEGKCRVKLEHGGEVLDVDEEDVEKVYHVYFCVNVNIQKTLFVQDQSVFLTTAE